MIKMKKKLIECVNEELNIGDKVMIIYDDDHEWDGVTGEIIDVWAKNGWKWVDD